MIILRVEQGFEDGPAARYFVVILCRRSPVTLNVSVSRNAISGD
jgi:hypothetical protein